MAKASKRAMGPTAPEGSRYDELKQMLQERLREVGAEVQDKIRSVRTEGAERPRDVVDQSESSEVDIQSEIALALIQMKAETLNNINTGLRRLEEGRYGLCFDCGEEISKARLRALPFAARCKDCEEIRQTSARREQTPPTRRGTFNLLDHLDG